MRQQLTIESHCIERSEPRFDIMKVLREIVGLVPFVGSVMDIGEGISEGNWAQIGVGVAGLALDVFTGGEGGELLRIGRGILKRRGAAAAEREVAEIAEKEIAEALGKRRVNPCGCFVQGTLVLTDSGYKKIEQVEPGDVVWAYSDVLHTFARKKVVRVFQYVRDTVFQVHLGNEVINTTGDHPFFIGGKWLKVQKLHAGDSVLTYAGKKLVIDNIRMLNKQAVVYNFEVEDYHTYYVSAQGILVHNSGPCDNVPGLRTIIEEKEASKVYDKLDKAQKKSVDEAIALVREGKAGKNQHELKKELKGFKAIDVRGTGKNRGAVRIVYKESVSHILIHSIQDYH